MQHVSQAWLDNQQKTLVNEGFVEVSLSVADPDSVADASSEDNGAIYISNSSVLVSEVDKDVIPYITLEQNIWLLDGSMKMIPESDFGDIGYVGNVLSDTDGYFSDGTPLITINFTKVHENLIPGITIKWGTAYNEFASEFTVTVYNGANIAAEKTITGNTLVTSVVEMDIVDYDKIEIRILKWCLPEHRPRIEEIFVGIEKVYSKQHIFNYKHTQNADPISATLPKSEVTFSIDNRDNTYNPHNPVGLTKYLMERQEIRSRYGFRMDNGSIEWIPGGIFHLSEWDSDQNGITASFKARDALEYMSGIFYKGVYNPAGTCLYDLAAQILTEANLPLNSDGTLRWHVDESLKNITTTAPLPIDTYANCLQLIANAGGCVMYQDRKGILRIEPLSIKPVVAGFLLDADGNILVDSNGCTLVPNDAYDERNVYNGSNAYEISMFNSFQKSEMTLAKPLKQVNVSVYSYFSTEDAELYRGIMQLSGSTELIIEFKQGAVNAVASITGGMLISAEYYTNACILTIDANGEVEVVVNGTSLKESKSDLIVSSGKVGEISTLDNPLITDRNRALTVGSIVESYLKNRRTLQSSWRVDPRVDVLDIVKNINEYGQNNMLLTSVAFDYSGAFHGTAEGRVVV